MKMKKVEATGVSLSEALSSLSEWGESGREFVIHARA